VIRERVAMPRVVKHTAESDSDYSVKGSDEERRGRGGGGGGPSNLNKDDISRMVSDVVLYCLVTDQKKALIKRSEIVKQCNLGKGLSKVEVDRVMDQVERHFMDTFGLRLQEKEDRRGVFMLVNTISEGAGQGNIQWSDTETAQMGITFAILGLVFMSGGRVTDETLLRFVRNLGLVGEEGRGRKGEQGTVEQEVSQLFDGDIKRFVNDTLVSKQQYLRRTRVVEVEGEQYEYSWGERAEAEVKKSTVLKFVCELYGCRPRMFAEQFDIVKQEEGEEALESDDEEEQ